LFTLSYVADNPQGDLQGIFDTEHTGVTGYSFDGYNTYAVSGARIDENYYRAQCPEPDEITSAIVSKYSVFGCWPLREWDTFTAHAAAYKVDAEDGLWQPMTDPRIRAVVPMAGEGWWLFGERGLNAVNIPVLILDGTADDLYKENALMFTKIGSSEKHMISFIGYDHMRIYDEDFVALLVHFQVAFFSFHLKGEQEYQKYYSEEFVGQFDTLAWGPYNEK
jgi:predicted dienelactone hydrolase